MKQTYNILSFSGKPWVIHHFGQLSSIAYTYDSIGNIIRVNSSYPMPQYQVTERYSYDSADQLLTAESTCNNNLLCSGAYSYNNNWGKINTYTQQTTDPATNISENKNYRYYFPGSSADMAQGQTSFAPIIKYDMHQNPQPLETCTYGINGSIRKRYDHPTQNTDYYYFNASGNLKACGTDMQISVYGYNSANTRTYKVNLFNANQWVNGQPQPIQPMVQSAMFYPNTYINFTQAGEYTKHYYNGTERICSRLGEQQIPISVENEQELEVYQQDVKQIIYNAIGQHLYDEPTNMQEGEVLHLEYLQPCGNSNAVFYYHPNHLSSTMYVTDMQQSVVQSFLYAPYGEIISEYNTHAMGEAFPKYSFNAKELDEETGMYYYEARYYAPPTFTSRDAMFEKYPTFSPYTYCMSNPIKYVDPDGKSGVPVIDKEKKIITIYSKLYFYGSAANSELSKKIATGIASQWNGANAKYEIDGVEYSVKFRISYETVSVKRAKELAKNNTDPKNNFIRVARGPKGKSSFTLGKGNSFWFNVNDDLENSTTPSHEFGHGLGLSHPIVDLSETTERPDIMVPRNKRYGIYWSIKNSAGVRVVNPNSRRVTEKNVKEAILKGCGQVNNIIINDDGTY